MELVITMLEEQIRISENRLTTNHYPLEIEPTVRLKINQCNEAIDILRVSQNASTSDEALHIGSVSKRNWFERLPLHWRYIYYMVGGIVIGYLLHYVC